ncbi:cytochrome P450 [Lentinus tigrinus ALCF2SS1-7]|uniref:Cytochrome P450 n=1 Tax=Lentinus tigrinus ALCF2SS1-6 TaxID=1328759 RepID=A0A5C2SN80_9APHY|nr:cytochrome P450 [Lentinus tigrinus ALCF2SS1-6]RPD82894.1 cytochrome P450 [Lentinus tigrinus ALCF2SS1-7]
MGEPNLYAYALLGFLVLFCLWRWKRDPLNAIPTAGGPSAPLLSYIGGFRFRTHSHEMVQEGYNKYGSSVFKVAMLHQWLVCLNGPEFVDQVRKAPESVISSMEGLLFLTQLKHYIPEEATKDAYHITVIREKLTRKLDNAFSSTVDELAVVCDEILPVKPGDNVALPGRKAILDIIARVVSRTFVSLPLCRDAAYLDAAVMFTLDVTSSRVTLNLFPERMRGFASRYIATGPADNIRRMAALIAPLVRKRIRLMEEQGKDGAELPDDMLQWLLNEGSKRNNMTVEMAATRLQLQNFAALHTSSSSLVHALFHILADPSLVAPLRDEVKAALGAEGWKRTFLEKMPKMDSFLKESQRFNGINILGMTRRAMQDITLADGTFLPAGTLLAVPSYSPHHDEEKYEGANEFKPFRFSDSEDAGSTRHQFVNTSDEYMAFGRGKHACPGRFFAAMELKIILAYLLMNYDMELQDKSTGRPANVHLGIAIVPDPNAMVVFKKR